VVSLRAPLPAGDAPAGSGTHHKFVGGTIIKDVFQWAATVKTRRAVIARFTTTVS
jgi:hypothetical protein